MPLVKAVAVVTAPAPAALLHADRRIERVEVVSSSHPVGWRIAVARHLWRAHQLGHEVVNLEVYPPRWRFIRGLTAWMGLAARHIDLPAILSDRTRHMSTHYAATIGVSGEPPQPPDRSE